jgi:hypothetical protein
VPQSRLQGVGAHSGRLRVIECVIELLFETGACVCVRVKAREGWQGRIIGVRKNKRVDEKRCFRIMRKTWKIVWMIIDSAELFR